MNANTAKSEHDSGRAERFHEVTDILRCKWTVAVIEAIASGANRPTEIKDRLPGISDKVLSERLGKLQRFGMLERTAFAEVPPRVEYHLTDRGSELCALIQQIAAFVDRGDTSDSP